MGRRSTSSKRASKNKITGLGEPHHHLKRTKGRKGESRTVCDSDGKKKSKGYISRDRSWRFKRGESPNNANPKCGKVFDALTQVTKKKVGDKRTV